WKGETMRKVDFSNAASLPSSNESGLSLESVNANSNPLTLSAEENDRLLVECFLTGSHASLGFARLLLELHETRRYFALGFPSTAHYAETRFRIARTQAMEHVRVARALRQLPVLTKALEDGELSWSLLAEITRVATKDSEEEWLAFATKHGFHRTRAEVRSAREEKRSRPRRGEYGLPRLSQRFSLSLAPEEMALVEMVLADVAAAAGKRLGSASHEPI